MVISPTHDYLMYIVSLRAKFNIHVNFTKTVAL